MTDGSIHVLISRNTQHHTNVAEERSDNHTLDDNQLQDAPRLGADGFADAKLVGTFLDGD